MLRPSAGETLRAWLLSALVVHGAVAGNPDAKRLYDDLLSNYNKLVRPVVNTSDVLRVCIKLKLSQLIDVLPMSTATHYDEEIDFSRKTEIKNERDILSVWNSDRMSGDPDANDMEDDRLFPYVPYVKTYKGFRSSMTESFFSKNLEKRLSKMSLLDERGRKSKLISNSLEMESTRGKHPRSPHTIKPKRKSHKVNRSERLSRKFRNVDSTREFKKMLQNFKFISQEELAESSLESKGSRNIVPAYFILKLAPDSEKNAIKKNRCTRPQSLKLVFANDEVEEKSGNGLPPVETKDKINQTSDLDEKPTLENRPKDAEFIDKEGTVNCLTWSKVEQEFRFQREFNAGLLGQIQNLLMQLTTVTGLLSDLLYNKTGNDNQFFQDLAKKRQSSEETAGFNLRLTDFDCGYKIHKEVDPVFIDAAFNEVYGSARMFKKEFEDESAMFSPGNFNVFPSIQDDSAPIRETRRRRNIESAVFDVKSKCSCQVKHHERGKGNGLTLPRNFNVGNLKKTLLEQSDYVNKRPGAKEDLKIGRTDSKEDEDEDVDYDESGDEMEDDCDKRRVAGGMKKYGKAATSRSPNIMKRLREDQLRLSLDEADDDSNDALIYSNEDPAIKLSSRASSRRNLKNQIMTTNLWVEQSWYDYKLRWDPKEYGGVHMLHVPSDHIWRPDIVLYNNADGNYEVTLMTKARVSHTGLVEWQPPAVYKSSCAIDVEFFPYDIQTCVLKLGSWTYDGFKVDLRHMDEKAGSNVVEVGVDLSEFYMSVEWDILEVPAVRNEKFYTCCDEPYLDITFNITMRRKTLFYTVNIIIPCMGISFLTVLTFYLPSDSGEKVTLSISILISLHVFFLLVVEIIPPTSLVVPLLGKYLIFAMILVSISICVTVVVLNVHFRSPQTHRMAPWVKRVFIHILPRLLVMRRPQYHFEPHRFMSRRVIMQTVKGKEIQTSYYPYPYQASAPAEKPKLRDIDSIITRQRALSKEDFSPESLADGEPVFGGSCQIHGPPPQSESEELSLSGVEGAINDGEDLKSPTIKNPAFSHSMCPPEVHKSCFCVRFIAEHTKMLEDSTKVKEDWKYVAMVLDRLFLWIFTLAVLVGTAGIILQAPTLYDDRIPIDKQFAEIQTSTVIRCPPQ